ncbi:MAG: tetratricopeptide repeat protein [Bacteroidales bacterium]|nr:tetratricopeptide repeat protein [Bacteroidales bacterium]
MFRFENPSYLYFLAIIPLLAILHYATDLLRRRRLKRYGDPDLLKALMPDVSVWRRELKFWLVTAAFGMMIVCLARPQYGTKIDTRTRKGIEAIIALDVSNSMLAEDVKPSRLDKSKLLISSLVDKMVDDKVGLIVYAGDAYTQLPITSDYVSAKMFLDNISPDMIAVQGTDIARAIDLATHSFTQQEGVGRAIFVITDGEDNEGGAVEAAREAQKKGMAVYVLGVGSPEGSPIPLPGSNRYITDNAGNTVVSKLNEDMCRQIAQAGGGAYIYVDNSSSAQSALQRHVDKLAKAEMESVLYSEYDEHFRDFAWAALVLLFIDILFLARKNRIINRFKLFRVPSRGAALFAILFLSALAPSTLGLDNGVAAQKKNDRYFVRHGNRFYRDSTYAKAQVDYQKAIEKDNTNPVAHYNLGNAQLMQGQPKEAMKSYETAARLQKDKLRGAQAYHNMGVIFQSQKQYAEAIECYKNALRRNPKDDETRYNLALCQHQLQNQQQDQNNKDDQQGKDDQRQDQQQQQDQQKQQQQQQDQQQQQPQQEQPKMSKENAEQLLQAAQQEEKSTQEKVNKAQQQPQRRQLEKQW